MACCKCCKNCQPEITNRFASEPTPKKPLSPEVAHLLHHLHLAARDAGARISDAYRQVDESSVIWVDTKRGLRRFQIQDPPINEAWVEENIARFLSLLVHETKT